MGENYEKTDADESFMEYAKNTREYLLDKIKNTLKDQITETITPAVPAGLKVPIDFDEDALPVALIYHNSNKPNETTCKKRLY